MRRLTKLHLPDGSKWIPCVMTVVALMTVGAACASDDTNDSPPTTAGATLSTTADPDDGPQPSLKAGSNLPPDDDPNAPTTPTTATSSDTVPDTGG